MKHIVVTGTGLAVPGLARPLDLLADEPPGTGFDPATALKGKEMRGKDRASRLGLCAADAALRDAGLLADDGTYREAGETTAVVVSSNLGTLETACEFTDTIAREGVTGLSPLGLPQTSSNVVAGWIAIRYGLRGPNLTVCNGATSGLDAVHWACHLILAGRCRRAVVVGVEPASEPAGRLLGQEPRDVTAAVVLESAADAIGRGARAHAAVSAYARGADAARTVAATESRAPVPVQLRLATGHLDLTARLGDCSGALGVLQCAAGADHVRSHGTGAVLAVAGGTAADDAAAALLLTTELRN
ncbi:beta-ketoacyl synthase N-terminal-like domain-containing protein [Streptomyces luteireticuli]|uniref:beta-ketoacyl synthase N-terminal-like domain-containing protein n=1 Tax=Streptomyces luteireticuli TaxID=173858 RepID=UPI003557434C